MRHLLDSLCAIAGFRPTIVQEPTRVRSRDSDFLVGDPGKVEKETGWRPEIPIEKTLEDLYREARARVRAGSGS
jgi:GDP-4-dehydro-6-deoxy-D-mannose reductase